MSRDLATSSLMLLSILAAGVAAADRDDADSDPVTTAFRKLDTDGNGKLSLDEYVQQSGTRKRLERDFRVFDLNGDGQLTPAEFAAIPGLVAPHLRGPLPDPFDGLLQAAIEALDESYNHWSRQPNLTIPPRTFAIEFMASLHPEDSRRFDPALVPLVDRNGDGRVTWNEAQQFLEIQLGLRWHTGQRLRQPNGRYLMMRAFLWVDHNKDNVVTREEFLKSEAFNWVKEDKLALFERGDQNGDGVIDLDEYADPAWVAYEDPITTFLNWDKDFDGLLDADELTASAADYLQSLLPSTIPAFDLDGDGKLSLDEFRLSMLGNRFIGWNTVPTDNDRDRLLTFDEFQWEQAHCHLLRRFYFHRLDRNGDGRLSLDEFSFKVKPSNAFHLLAADGSECRLLYVNDDVPNCGSPAMSPNGKLIAFDGYRGGESIRSSRLLLINADGTGFRDVGDGLMPTWSRDGRQLACSRYGEGSSVWIVNLNGTDSQRIDDGWGAQWSPDGRTIAYTKANGLWAYDVSSGQSREVLRHGVHPFSYIYYNMTWSPDSSRLAFKARNQQGQYDLASVSMSGGDTDLQVHYTTPQNFDADLTWAPDGQRIVFCMRIDNRSQLYELDTTTDDPPQVVPGLDEKINYLGGVTFTTDGKWMILSTRE